MSSFELSEYQKRIVSEVKSNNTNILVNAKAGSGKTSTLLLIADELKVQGKYSLFLAFNKSIVDELKTKIDTNWCEVKTLHSLGYSYILSDLYSRFGKGNYYCNVSDKYSLFSILKEHFDEFCGEDFNNCGKVKGLNGNNRAIAGTKLHILFEFKKLLNYIRATGTELSEEAIKESCSHISEVVMNPEYFGTQNYVKLFKFCLDKVIENYKNPSIKMGRFGAKPTVEIDYTDMLWIPIQLKLTPPSIIRKVSNMLVDECQDLNYLQQELLKSISTYKSEMRFIFVGDNCQAIYGFAGADTKSIQTLTNKFDLVELPLNICYRCPKKIIEIAQQIVPDIEYNKVREDEGEVTVLYEGKNNIENYLGNNDIVISRTNKDLLMLYRKLAIHQHTPVKFLNAGMVEQVVGELKGYVEKYLLRFNELYLPLRNLALQTHTKNKSFMKKLLKDSVAEDIIVNNLFSPYKNKDNDSLEVLQYAMKEFEYYYKYREHLNYNNALKYLNNVSIEEMKQNQVAFDTYFDPDLDEYSGIISEFIKDYLDTTGLKIENAKIEDFKDFVSQFLRQYENEEVPKLSSVHKMKGGEADNIFIYNIGKLPLVWGEQTDEQFEQEMNLKYVALTRAKKHLYLYVCKDPKENAQPEYLGQDYIDGLIEQNLIPRMEVNEDA